MWVVDVAVEVNCKGGVMRAHGNLNKYLYEGVKVSQVGLWLEMSPEAGFHPLAAARVARVGGWGRTTYLP